MFSEMEERLTGGEATGTLKLRRDRWPSIVMLMGVVMTTPAMLGLKGDWVIWVVLAGLALELCGFVVLISRQIRDIAPEFKDAKRKFAVELDAKFIQHQHLLTWLRSLPKPERDRRLAYLDSRIESMSSRYPILFGSVDKLGVLPILVAGFIQWHAIQKVSFATGALAFVIFVFYGMALWMVRFRLQMQTYERLLRADRKSVV